MSDPITFDSVTPRFALPLLHAGQAQKELFVNEAFSLTDALLHSAIENIATAPPSSPQNGQSWLVGSGAFGAWTGQSGKLACRQADQWIFIGPSDGMRLINKATGQDMRRIGGTWHSPAAPTQPTGGSVIDSQARETINLLLQKLRDAGIFATE